MQSIVARYTRDDKEYSVVVSGRDKELNGTAPDIVAARKLADKLVKKVAGEPSNEPVVVHLLDDSAIEFTRAYLNATLFGPRAGSETAAPQSRKRSERRRHRAPAQETGTTDRARRTSTGVEAAEEKSADNTDNDTANDTGSSSS
ncbi:hypothetical protein [Actinophytocola sp. KF-1]|jgi:hypothetical protein